MTDDDRYVLDSFALLALLEDEEGAGEVEEILSSVERGRARAWLSIINFGEVLYIVEREQGLKAAHRAAAIIDQLPLTVMEPGRERTFAAAHVKARFPLSYADAFAVALAQELEARVVTGDPEFKKVASMVTVHWIATAKKKKTPGEKKPRGPETIRKKSTL